MVPLSAAVYQPKGYNYPKVSWTDIRRDGPRWTESQSDPSATGTWIRPREFVYEPDPLKAYADALRELYAGRLFEARVWRDRLQSHVALCCWCPYDRAAQRQLGEWGSFVCHTAIVGEFIEESLGLAVWYDSDRRRMKHLL